VKERLFDFGAALLYNTNSKGEIIVNSDGKSIAKHHEVSADRSIHQSAGDTIFQPKKNIPNTSIMNSWVA